MSSKEEYKERDYRFIKEIIEDSIKPIIEITCEHHIALNGNDKRSGIIKDINDLKLGVLLLKWAVGLGFTATGTTIIFAIIKFLYKGHINV
jgi:hypothetical protein